MPAPAKISDKSSALVPRARLAFARRRLRADPLTKDLAVPFDAYLAEWVQISQMEHDLVDTVEECTVLCVACDFELDRFAKMASKTILTIVDDDTGHALYTHYFKGKPLHLFVKPLFGEELEAMRGWLPSLATSEHPSLKALHDGLAALIAKADDTLKAKADAKQALADFRDIGARKGFFNKVNALLKETWGALSGYPLKFVGLPSNFADTFFLRDRPRRGKESEPTVESVELEVSDLEAQLALKQDELATLKHERIRAAAKADAERKGAAQKKLAQAERDLQAKAREIAELKAQLEPGLAPAPQTSLARSAPLEDRSTAPRPPLPSPPPDDPAKLEGFAKSGSAGAAAPLAQYAGVSTAPRPPLPSPAPDNPATPEGFAKSGSVGGTALLVRYAARSTPPRTSVPSPPPENPATPEGFAKSGSVGTPGP